MYLTLYAPNRLMDFDRIAHFIDEKGKKQNIRPYLSHPFS